MSRYGLILILALMVCGPLSYSAQEIYYRKVNSEFIRQFKDSTGKIIIYQKDSLLNSKFAYALKFYPNLQYNSITLDYKRTKYIARTRPTFAALFQLPSQRNYKITFSELTASTMDSVLLNNLTLDSQIGLIANQLSMIEDLSTGGFFTNLGFFIGNLTAKGKNKIYRQAEEKTLELGLGYQLLNLNEEFIEKLKIENWRSTIGYSTYIHYYRNRPMNPELVRTFINDLPVYVQHTYR